MVATLQRGNGKMAQKGRGIFMVYVDIDAQHVQEFNKWYSEEHLPELLSVRCDAEAAKWFFHRALAQLPTVNPRTIC